MKGEVRAELKAEGGAKEEVQGEGTIRTTILLMENQKLEAM
jgi:hypothetical protein